MTALSKATLKNIWRAGFQPKASDFGNLIDSWADYNSQSSLTGAVSRVTTEKIYDTVTVKDFGAVGDGLTDDTAAFQAAVSAARTILVPDGSYRIAGQVNIPSNTSIEMGSGTFLRSSSIGMFTLLPGSVLASVSCASVTAGTSRIPATSFAGFSAGCYIRIAAPTISGGEFARVIGVEASAGGQVLVLDRALSLNYVSATFNTVTRIQMNENIHITGGNISGAPQLSNGVIRAWNGANCTFNKINMSTNFATSLRDTISLDGCIDISVTGCRFENSNPPEDFQSASYGAAIFTSGVTNLSVIGCYFEAVSATPIRQTGGRGASAYFAGNSFNVRGFSQAAIGIGFGTLARYGNVVVSENVFDVSGALGSSCANIVAESSAIISNNIFIGSDYGLLVGSATGQSPSIAKSQATITGNNFRCATGIRITSANGLRDATITGNVFLTTGNAIDVSADFQRISMPGFRGSISLRAVHQSVSGSDVNADNVNLSYCVLTAASANVSSISNGYNGQTITFKTDASAQTILFQDGVGNLRMAGDFTLSAPEDTITFMRVDSAWLEVSRSNNGT